MHRVTHFILAALLLIASLAADTQVDTATVRVIRADCDTVLSLAHMPTFPLREVANIERDGTNATYQGAWLGEVLDLGCDSTARLDKHGTLRSVVKVTAADGFTAVVALAEAVEAFSAQPVLLAWGRNGQPLSERHGPFQLVVPGDLKPGRNVRQVKTLELITP